VFLPDFTISDCGKRDAGARAGERSEAIQSAPEFLDCFVASLLAMTELRIDSLIESARETS